MSIYVELNIEAIAAERTRIAFESILFVQTTVSCYKVAWPVQQVGSYYDEKATTSSRVYVSSKITTKGEEKKTTRRNVTSSSTS